MSTLAKRTSLALKQQCELNDTFKKRAQSESGPTSVARTIKGRRSSAVTGGAVKKNRGQKGTAEGLHGLGSEGGKML